jgi:predicted transcriptional regulator
MLNQKTQRKIPETREQTVNRLSRVVAMSLDLDGVDLRVFLYLIGSIGCDEFTHVPQMELATLLGRRKEHISRSIRKLTKAGVLLASPKGTRASEWRLNPDFGK